MNVCMCKPLQSIFLLILREFTFLLSHIMPQTHNAYVCPYKVALQGYQLSKFYPKLSAIILFGTDLFHPAIHKNMTCSRCAALLINSSCSTLLFRYLFHIVLYLLCSTLLTRSLFLYCPFQRAFYCT